MIPPLGAVSADLNVIDQVYEQLVEHNPDLFLPAAASGALGEKRRTYRVDLLPPQGRQVPSRQGDEGGGRGL